MHMKDLALVVISGLVIVGSGFVCFTSKSTTPPAVSRLPEPGRSSLIAGCMLQAGYPLTVCLCYEQELLKKKVADLKDEDIKAAVIACKPVQEKVLKEIQDAMGLDEGALQ